MGEFISQQESREPSRFSILAQLTLEDSLAAKVLAKGERWCECWQYLWHNAEILIRGLVVGRGVLIATKRGVNASRRPPNALIADCWRIVVNKSSSLSSLFGSLVVLIISTIYKHIWHIFWFSLIPPMWKKTGLQTILVKFLHLWKLFVFIIKEAHQAW